MMNNEKIDEDEMKIAFEKVRAISGEMVDVLSPIFEKTDPYLSLTSLNTVFVWVVCKSMRNFQLNDDEMDVQFQKVFEALGFLYKHFKESSKSQE